MPRLGEGGESEEPVEGVEGPATGGGEREGVAPEKLNWLTGGGVGEKVDGPPGDGVAEKVYGLSSF